MSAVVVFTLESLLAHIPRKTNGIRVSESIFILFWSSINEENGMIQRQSQLFSQYPRIEVVQRDGLVDYQSQFLTDFEADKLYDSLKHCLDWQKRKIFIFGQWRLQPRLIAFLGKTEIKYSYSGDSLTAVPWSDEIDRLVDTISQHLQHQFNVVLINYYRNGKDSIGWHADNEKQLGATPMIASLSLGQSRRFKLRHRDGQQKQLMLEHGSLLTMSGDSQKYWQHALPKTSTDGGRINLTFRNILF